MTAKRQSSIARFALVDEEISNCRLCPRLVAWREQVAREKRKSYLDWTYWGRGVPSFGDPAATRLIVGLAPAAHGANRTGRMFTGDRSGDWIYRALYKAGVANQPTSTAINDGLALSGALICAVVHCAPPDNKPLPAEFANCSRYLAAHLEGRDWTSILCLGGIAWNHVLRHLGQKRLPFAHGATVRMPQGPLVVGSYHPSQQNTFTGRLTEDMLDHVINLWLTG